MPSESKVTFYQGTQSQYDGLGSKDTNGIYFLSDTQSIYKGDTKYGGSGDIEVATSTSAGIVKPGPDFDVAAGITPENMLTPQDITTGTANGTIAVKGTDVAVKGLGSAAFTESSDYLISTDLDWNPIS